MLQQSVLDPPLICFNENLLKFIKNESYFVLEILFVLRIFKFFSCLSWSCSKKRLDKKAKVNFNFFDVKNSEASNYNTYIAQYLKK